MIRSFHIGLRLLLIACLAVYSSFATAGTTENGSYFFIEICANGAAETIQVDANGMPIDPMDSCRDCVMCAQMAAAPHVPMDGAALVLALYDFASDGHRYETPSFEKPNTRPMPRGPPLVARNALVLPNACAGTDDQTRDVGRFQFKDALV